LKSDEIASHFVFQLRGFELLLDTIGNSNDEKNTQLNESTNGASSKQIEQTTTLP
jgi:hypothetical protein